MDKREATAKEKVLIKILCPYYGKGWLPEDWNMERCRTCPVADECFRDFEKWYFRKAYEIWKRTRRKH